MALMPRTLRTNGFTSSVCSVTEARLTSKLYIDGVSQTLTQRAGTTSAKSADTWATAGANQDGNSDFNGRIDELSVYNTALTQAKVTAHYKASQSFSATYAYDGTGLRQSKTVNSVTNNMLWDTSGDLPMLLSDGTNSFIYGADGLPLSQFDSAGTSAGLLTTPKATPACSCGTTE